jgi:hypothetical protein
MLSLSKRCQVVRSTKPSELRNFTFTRKAIVGMLMVMVMLLSIFHLGYAQNLQAQTSNTCKAQPLSMPKASGYQPGYHPSYAIDNNLNTRWQNFGVGSWIQVYAGSGKVICSVDIAWYRGNFRQVDFVIYVWNTPLQKWVSVFSGISSGTTAGFERYNFRDVNGAYVMIRVNGNSENNYASISEIDVNGFVGSVDKFGTRKILPTKTGGQEWYMNMNNPASDSRSDPPSMTKNSDGSWKVTSTKVRYGVFTTSGYDPNKITTLNHASLAQKGYMQSSNDWKNFEMTGYVKVISGSSGENFAWYGRGGRHTGDGWPEGCEGSAYKGDLYYDGRTRFAKEQWHVSYVFTPHKQPIGSIEDKWVGFKTIMWNTFQNGATVVKMQIWLDRYNNNNWVKVDERIDSGGWGNEGGECSGWPAQRITWGGPIATFRWDGATNVHIKNFSVREIQPPSS